MRAEESGPQGVLRWRKGYILASVNRATLLTVVPWAQHHVPIGRPVEMYDDRTSDRMIRWCQEDVRRSICMVRCGEGKSFRGGEGLTVTHHVSIYGFKLRLVRSISLGYDGPAFGSSNACIDWYVRSAGLDRLLSRRTLAFSSTVLVFPN